MEEEGEDDDAIFLMHFSIDIITGYYYSTTITRIKKDDDTRLFSIY